MNVDQRAVSLVKRFAMLVAWSRRRNDRILQHTQWNLVVASNTDQVSQFTARLAFEELCETYRYLLYAFVRSHGHSAGDAQDLTQAFFAKIIETNGLVSAIGVEMCVDDCVRVFHSTEAAGLSGWLFRRFCG